MYTTLDQAIEAVDLAIADCTADFGGEAGEDDIAHDMIVAVAMDCTVAVARELCRTQLGWTPREVAAWFKSLTPPAVKITPKPAPAPRPEPQPCPGCFMVPSASGACLCGES